MSYVFHNGFFPLEFNWTSKLILFQVDCIARLLMIINSSVNFLVYCGGSTSFQVSESWLLQFEQQSVSAENVEATTLAKTRKSHDSARIISLVGWVKVYVSTHDMHSYPIHACVAWCRAHVCLNGEHGICVTGAMYACMCQVTEVPQVQLQIRPV